MINFQKIAEEYALRFSLHSVFYVKTENSSKIYYLDDDSMQGQKTGWPLFIKVNKQGEVTPVSDIREINRLIRYCNTN